MSNIKFLTGFLLLSLVSLSHAAWEPPIGIPAPDFGIDEVAPAQPAGWPDSAVPGYYYIDVTHEDATDTDNPYGYPSRPRRTISTSSYSAGSYVEVHGGPYSERYALNFNCSEAQPCWFRGASQAEMPVFDGYIDIINSEYVIFENIDVNGGSGSSVGIVTRVNEDAHHIVFRHSNIRNRIFPYFPPGVNPAGQAGIGIIPWYGSTISDIVIYNNKIHTLGDYQETEDTDFHGVTVSLWGRDTTTFLSRVWILDNYCYYISGNCAQINSGNWDDFSHEYLEYVYIGRNVSHDGRQGAFGIKQSSHVIISQNTMYSADLVGAQSGDGVGTQYGPDNLWILFNEVYDTPYGVRQTSTGTKGNIKDHNTYIIGNLFHNLKTKTDMESAWGSYPGWGISLWHGILSRHIVNNTFYNTHGGVFVNYDGPVHINNNVFDNIRLTTPGADHIIVNHPGRAGMSSQDGNVFDITASFEWWNSELPEDDLIRGVSYTLSDYVTKYPDQCLTCIEGVNPLFVDPENANFRLQANSPLIDQSSENYVYQRFFDLYGIDIRVDYDGKSRPSGAGWEAGAFEYYDAANTAPIIISSSFFDATLGSAYSTALKGYGGNAPYAWALNDGVLPSGLTLNADGTVIGTPSVAGKFTVEVKMTDQSDVSTVKTLSLIVVEPVVAPAPETLSMASLVMLDATQNNAYTHTFSAAGGTETYAWSIGVDGNALPNSLSLNAAGVLSGTPIEAGVVTFDVSLSDGENTLTRTVSLTVVAPVVVEPALNITTASLTMSDAIQNSAYTHTFGAAGGTETYAWSVGTDGNDLPNTLSLNAVGVLSGTPIEAGVVTFDVSLSDGESSLTRTVSLTVAAAAPVEPVLNITTTSLPEAVAGNLYQMSFEADIGTAPYRWWHLSGDFPPGMNLTAAGEFIGAPTTAGSYTFTVKVEDQVLNTATQELTLNVAEATVLNMQALTINSETLPTGTVGGAYTAILNVQGGSGLYSWTVTAGELPSGIILTPGGLLTGKPELKGSFSATAQVRDSLNNTEMLNLTFVIENSQVSNIEVETDVKADVDVKAEASLSSSKSSGLFGAGLFPSLLVFMGVLFVRLCYFSSRK